MAKGEGGKPPGKPKPTGRKASVKDEKSQSERFIETARMLGVDESDAAFEEAFLKIAIQKVFPTR